MGAARAGIPAKRCNACALRRARSRRGRADLSAVQGPPVRGRGDGHHGRFGRRRVLPDRLRRCNGLDPRRTARHVATRRPLRRDRAARRGPAHGDDHRVDRSRLLRPHLLGVPSARPRERCDRLEAAAVDGEDAARRSAGATRRRRVEIDGPALNAAARRAGSSGPRSRRRGATARRTGFEVAREVARDVFAEQLPRQAW